MTEHIQHTPADAIHLFVRNDEKMDMVKTDLQDYRVQAVEMSKRMDRIDDRVDNGVAKTGQMNSAKIAEHAVELGKLIQQVGGLDEEINNQESGIFKQIREIKEAVGLIYKGIVGIFFTVIAGGAILYAMKVVKFH